MIYVNEFFEKYGNTTIDFWYEILNPDDFINIDLSEVSHGFENSEVGFYDLNILDNIKPDGMKEILKM